MFLIDILLIVLTSVCIWYCYSLTLKIKSLQENRDEFLKIIKYFDSIISKADESVNNLNEISEKASLKLANNISKAQILSEDLVFMNEIGSELAEKMEKNIEKIRSEKSDVDLPYKNTDNANMENTNKKSFAEKFIDVSIRNSNSNTDDEVSIPNISVKNIADSKENIGTDYYSTLRKLNKNT